MTSKPNISRSFFLVVLVVVVVVVVMVGFLTGVTGLFLASSTPRVFHVETTWKRSFPRRFNVEHKWSVCRTGSFFEQVSLALLGFLLGFFRYF